MHVWSVQFPMQLATATHCEFGAVQALYSVGHAEAVHVWQAVLAPPPVPPPPVFPPPMPLPPEPPLPLEPPLPPVPEEGGVMVHTQTFPPGSVMLREVPWPLQVPLLVPEASVNAPVPSQLSLADAPDAAITHAPPCTLAVPVSVPPLLAHVAVPVQVSPQTL